MWSETDDLFAWILLLRDAQGLRSSRRFIAENLRDFMILRTHHCLSERPEDERQIELGVTAGG